MNKQNTQSILKFSLLIVIAITSGCGQSIVPDSQITVVQNTNSPEPSQTATLENIVLPSTPIPCNSSPKTSFNEVEKVAEEWFQSSIPDIPNRDLYSQVDDWKGFCQSYQYAALNNNDWINNPVDTAVLTMGVFNQDEFFPDKVIVITNPDNHNIVTVVVTKLNMIVKVAEGRIDLIRENGIWQIMWIGTRVKCNSTPDNWSIIGCQ